MHSMSLDDEGVPGVFLLQVFFLFVKIDLPFDLHPNTLYTDSHRNFTLVLSPNNIQCVFISVCTFQKTQDFLWEEMVPVDK